MWQLEIYMITLRPPLINLGQNCELNHDLFHALATRINILAHIFITFIYKKMAIISIFF